MSGEMAQQQALVIWSLQHGNEPSLLKHLQGFAPALTRFTRSTETIRIEQYRLSGQWRFLRFLARETDCLSRKSQRVASWLQVPDYQVNVQPFILCELLQYFAIALLTFPFAAEKNPGSPFNENSATHPMIGIPPYIPPR